jgi:hypothetical protein
MAWYDWKGLGVMVLFLNIGFLHTAGMDHAMHIIDMDMIWKEGQPRCLYVVVVVILVGLRLADTAYSGLGPRVDRTASFSFCGCGW